MYFWGSVRFCLFVLFMKKKGFLATLGHNTFPKWSQPLSVSSAVHAYQTLLKAPPVLTQLHWARLKVQKSLMFAFKDGGKATEITDLTFFSRHHLGNNIC